MKMDKLHKILSKKKDLSGDMEKSAKMDVINHLKDMASGQMKDKMGGAMKKVSVASDSAEGLKAGLDKAHDIVDQHGQDQDDPQMMHEGGEMKNPDQLAEAADEAERVEDEKNDEVPRISGPDDGHLNHMFNEDQESDSDRLESEMHTDPQENDEEISEDPEEEMTEDEIDQHLKDLMSKKAKFKKA